MNTCTANAGKGLKYNIKPGSTTSIYKGSNSLDQLVKNIMSELHTGGPISMGMNLDDNFSKYKGGVYEKTGADSGGHAMTLVGWGVEGNTDYWLIQNRS